MPGEDISSFEQCNLEGDLPDLLAVPEVMAMAAAIAQIEEEKPLVQHYRTVQGIQLTSLQHKVLARVTDEKLEAAKLRDLMDAFKTLKTMEHLVDGKPTEIKGLVAYLIQIEKEKVQTKIPDAIDITETKNASTVNGCDTVDTTVEDVKNV